MIHNEDGCFVVDDICFPDIDKNSYLKFISYFDELIWISAREHLVGFEIINKKLVEKLRICMPKQFQDGINYITKIKETYYMTAWGKGQIFLFNDFSELDSKICNDNEKFGFLGTPYFITDFDGKFYITEIDFHQGIYEFTCDEKGMPVKLTNLFSFDEPTESDIKRKQINPVLRL